MPFFDCRKLSSQSFHKYRRPKPARCRRDDYIKTFRPATISATIVIRQARGSRQGHDVIELGDDGAFVDAERGTYI